MSRLDELTNLSPLVYDYIMGLCEEIMLDDNLLESLAREMQLTFENTINKLLGGDNV